MYVFPEWRLNLCFGTQKKCPFPWTEATTGGQKCCNLFSDISETSDTSPPTPNKVEFWANGWNDCFFGHNIAGEGVWGDDGMYPKEIKKLLLGAESYLEGLFHTVQSSLIFVLHCRCPFKRGSKYKDYMNIFGREVTKTGSIYNLPQKRL